MRIPFIQKLVVLSLLLLSGGVSRAESAEPQFPPTGTELPPTLSFPESPPDQAAIRLTVDPSDPTGRQIITMENLTSDPMSLGAIGFDFQATGGEVDLSDFSWSFETAPGMWFATSDLPNPQAVAFFPAAALPLPPGSAVEIARMAIAVVSGTPVLNSGIVGADENVSPIQFDAGSLELSFAAFGGPCLAPHSTVGCPDTDVQWCVCNYYSPHTEEWPYEECCYDTWDAYCSAAVFQTYCRCHFIEGDCNNNGTNDACEGEDPDTGEHPPVDCNDNGFSDLCDTLNGTSTDCDGNGLPDECQLDCNDNAVPDVCEMLPAPAVLYVDQHAPGTGNGGSWADAFKELRTATCVASQFHPSVQEIWVAEGTYKPAPPNGSRTARFGFGDMSAYGGFAGTETHRDQRDPAAHPTILSGDLNGDDGPDFQNYIDNAVVVVHFVSESLRTLDGFTITGGNGGGSNSSYYGALRISGTPPNVVNCVFAHNRNTGQGGAVRCFSRTRFTNCVFIQNEAYHGGAIYTRGSDIVNCGFIDNRAYDDGGAVYSAIYTDSLDVTNTLFHQNNAADSGGALHSLAAPHITNSILWDNTAGNATGEAAQFSTASSFAPSINYSIVTGWTGAFGGVNNTGADPMFVDPENANYRLLVGSPAVDAGNNEAVPPEILTDLDGLPRMLDVPFGQDSGSGNAPIVDIGPHELAMGDADTDGQVGLLDFSLWPICVTGPGGSSYPAGCELLDFDADLDVDVIDFAGFQRANSIEE